MKRQLVVLLALCMLLSLLLPGTAAMALGYFILAAAVACRHLTPKESETPELVVLGRHIKSR